jgi:hypothetical protein
MMREIFNKSYLVFLLGMGIIFASAWVLPSKEFFLVCCGAIVVYTGGLLNE